MMGSLRRRLAVLVLVALMLGSGVGLASGSQAPGASAGVAERVGIVVGDTLSNSGSLLRVRGLVESDGFPYCMLTVGNLTSVEAQVLIFVASTGPAVTADDLAGLHGEFIWVGGLLPPDLYPDFGVSGGSYSGGVKGVEYNGTVTGFFDETYISVVPAGASVEGYLIDGNGARVSPAEFRFRRGDGGNSVLFAYDAADYWNSDPDTPWLRASRLQAAVMSAAEEVALVRISAYPRSLVSAFVTRVEDVDPLHTSPEWLSRAWSYLDYYSARGATLSVAIIPRYVDGSVTAELGDPAAAGLRDWLVGVASRGGALVEHGYTHQIDGGKTGVAPEFYDEASGTWLSYQDQLGRISLGRGKIEGSLGFPVEGFEAPHYVANEDTYRALSELGFRYVTHSSDMPFIDRFSASGLVDVPETLGYIPNNPPVEKEDAILANMDAVYDLGGVSLLFNHLFQYEMLDIGERVLDHALSKEGMWVTNTDAAASFWAGRQAAYSLMNVELGKQVTVVLGHSDVAGLTLVAEGRSDISWVKVNGVDWPTFTGGAVVLPALGGDQNTVTIGFNAEDSNANLGAGVALTLVCATVSVVSVRRVRRRDEDDLEEWA